MLYMIKGKEKKKIHRERADVGRGKKKKSKSDLLQT
jgi:hypothetical protein